jgi:hypothetical protein
MWKQGDRIYETSTTTGTGTYTLAGAVTGFTSFSSLSAGAAVPYFATDDTNWEVGIGTVATGPNTLARTVILASSNSGAAVNWGSGSKKIRCGLPAEFSPRNALEARTSNTVLSHGDFGKCIDVTSGTFSQTFTAAATLGDGWRVGIRNTGSGVVTLDPNGSETINGSTTLVLNQGDSCVIVCDGSNFKTESMSRAPTRQVFLSGSSATYTTPVGCRQIKVSMKAGGGGGSGTGNSPTAGGNGGATSFNSITVVGGTGANATGFGTGGLGGTGGSGSASVRRAGQSGNGHSTDIQSGTDACENGGTGGGTGGGLGAGRLGAVAGTAGVANTGGGGGGGGIATASFATIGGYVKAGGGGEGEYAELIINNPAASYTYTVGAGGTAGGTSTNGMAGYAGGSGFIVVDEF